MSVSARKACSRIPAATSTRAAAIAPGCPGCAPGRAIGPPPVPGGPDDIFNGKSDTVIFDAVYKWAPNGNPVETNLKLQGEFFAHHDNGQFNSIPYSGWQTGFYAQAVYQFMPGWRVGARYDQVNGNRQTGLLAASTVDSLGVTPRRASAMLEYNTSEFGRFRLQYNRDWSRGTPDNQAILQYIINIGAHGAHIF